MQNQNGNTMIVEVGGVKMEVDMRHATIIHQNLAVGSKVKLLDKGGYGGATVHPGVIVGFNNFESAPTIIVVYVKVEYGNDSPVRFAYINGTEDSKKKWDMVPDMDDDMPVSRDTVLRQLDRQIEKAQAEVREALAKREYFLQHFGAYWPELALQTASDAPGSGH